MSMPPPPPSDPYRQQPGPSTPPPPPPGMYPGQPPTIYYNYAYAQMGRTSGLAIASMVLGIVWVYWIGSILAVIFGHVSLSQMNRDETLRGRGMAIAGLVLGYVGVGTLLLVIIIAAAASPR